MPARPVWAVPKIAGQKVSQNGKKCLLLFRSCIVKYLCHTTTTPSLRTRQHTWCMRVHRSVFGHDVPPHDARRRTLLAQARTPLSPRLVRIASSLLASRPPSGCGHARSQRQPAHRLTELRGPHAARAASRARARARARRGRQRGEELVSLAVEGLVRGGPAAGAGVGATGAGGMARVARGGGAPRSRRPTSSTSCRRHPRSGAWRSGTVPAPAVPGSG